MRPVSAVVAESGSVREGVSLLGDVVREGARRMLGAEVDAYLADLGDQRGHDGRGLVVRDGCHRPWQVVVGAGAIEVEAPRVGDKRSSLETGERERFFSAILPSWARKSPKIAEVLPLLYLHGLSAGDFVSALEQFLGSAAGFSPVTVARLAALWQADRAVFLEGDLSELDYVRVWAGGVRLWIRLGRVRPACWW
jgi:hypothetical protein